MISAVKKIELIKVTPTWVELEWQKQKNTKSVIIPVAELTRRDSSMTLIRRCVRLSAEATTGKVFNLHPDSEYTLRVGARKDKFTARYVEPTEPITFCTPAPRVPGPPDETEGAPGIDCLELRWKSNDNFGSPLELYDVQYSCDEINWKRQNLKHEGDLKAWQSTTLGDLTSNTVYFVKIRTRNGVGFGPNSQPKEYRTKAPRSPDPPPQIWAEDITITGFTVRWSLDAYDGGAKIVGYHLQIGDNTENAQFSWQDIEPIRLGSDEDRYSIRNLQHNTTYQVRIRGINRAGKGRYSTNLEVLTADFRVGDQVEVFIPGVLLAHQDWYKATLEYIEFHSATYGVRSIEKPDEILEIETTFIRPRRDSNLKTIAGSEMDF